MASKIPTSNFFQEWKGHPIAQVSIFNSITRATRPNKPIIYLAGDSSLDNKAWIPSPGPNGEPLPVDVPDIYPVVLERPTPKPDVAFWLNHLFGDRATALNLAVEESLLRERSVGLLKHDRFIRDHLRDEDILVVSVGANDIALKPTFSTILRMLQLAWLTPRRSLERGTAWSLSYSKDLFKNQLQTYVTRLVEKQRPRAVVICMIYFPLEAGASNQESWADLSLGLLGYNRHPEQLQSAIKRIYEIATKQIQIPETTVIPCALFDALDGKSAQDYIARVEPSTEGGRKMAVKISETLTPYLK
ncbi:MAG: hypothetical protein M1820_004170 [Bogoriella megaspora]|nr:MAG: hypothetical protein M1820_004170 [Bogoriella megaspora]